MSTVMAAEKACTRCDVVKPLSAFGDHPSGRYGKKSWCNECYRVYRRKQRASDPEERARNRAQNRAYRAAEANLRERHRPEFEELYDQQLRRVGLL